MNPLFPLRLLAALLFLLAACTAPRGMRLMGAYRRRGIQRCGIPPRWGAEEICKGLAEPVPDLEELRERLGESR
ncbi:MAG TPA: hypothetical protein VGR27_13245 [Longimicrobiaceae bacterium]|nr:hypothetical protein [Longimicrobiaceae bacterium]